MTDSPSLEEPRSWSDAGGRLTETESLLYRYSESYTRLTQPDLFSLNFYLSLACFHHFTLHCFHLPPAVSHTCCSLCLFNWYRDIHTPPKCRTFLCLCQPPSFSLSSLQRESLSIHHDPGLGWPPVLIRESVISSAQSLTTHQRHTV